MNITFSQSMKEEILTVVKVLKKSGEKIGFLPSNTEYEISLTDNGGDKISIDNEVVFIKTGNLFGNIPLSERKMI